jgi:tRNA (guanosine-2'-O-)-methyltransferase
VEVVTRTLAPLIAERRRRRIERVLARRLASVTVLIERPYDPHNAAAVLRSCEAFGLLHVHIVPYDGRCSFSPQVTQNADKWLNIYLHPTIEAACDFLERCGFACWAALPPPLEARRTGAGVEVPVTGPLALVFGNEHEGLSAAGQQRCSGRFHLPMFGFSESLNLSVSAALALREVVSRRRQALGRAGDLPPDARDQLRAAYYARSVRQAVPLICRMLGI